MTAAAVLDHPPGFSQSGAFFIASQGALLLQSQLDGKSSLSDRPTAAIMVDSPSKRLCFACELFTGIATMRTGSDDKTVLKQVNQRLMRAGTGGKTRVTATVSRGDVTLSGVIQYEMQRRTLTRAAGSALGVRRVIDQLKLEAAKPKGV
jgi:osmotically-inducible protein OsmY